MTLDLDRLLSAPLPPGTKSLPDMPEGFALADIARQGWSLLGGDLPMPAAVLKASALNGNVAAMQAYLARSGALLAPHGKTTMCPQLFERQLTGGAWGITVATITQARICHAAGVGRVLIANEVVGDPEIAMLARMSAERPDAEFYLLVDSLAGVERLQAGFAATSSAPPARVLVELGFPGGRCGARSVAEALDVARAVAGCDRLILSGVEGYEGLIVSDDPVADAAAVRDYLDGLVELVRSAGEIGLFPQTDRVLLSAGGSVYYDLVVALAEAALGERVAIVVRSGCYLTQDSGFYRRALADLGKRAAGGAAPKLATALEVWTRVLSVPEPGRAILGAGKRDLSFDIDLPVPERWFRSGEHTAPQPAQGWRIDKLSDQHAFALADPSGAVPLAVGDLVALGISHPCTTFDKWPLLLEVDDDYRVLGGLRTFF